MSAIEDSATETPPPESAGEDSERASRKKRKDPIAHPGTVLVNVQGAYIVDDVPGTPNSGANGGVNGSSTNGYMNGLPNGIVAPEDSIQHHSQDIRLPNHRSIVSHIAVDIGGSLAKLVYFSHEPHSLEAGGRLHFVKFETDKIDSCISFMQRLKASYNARNGGGSDSNNTSAQRPGRAPPKLCVMATGGGAFKYYDTIRAALAGVEVLREDEMECLIIGLDFFISQIPNEVFVYDEGAPVKFVASADRGEQNVYPYLLVNIGSGVSMVKVSGPRQFQRVGGTSLGGGTLWGLLSLLTGARSFEEMLHTAEQGDNTAVDMLVGDIYGMDYGKIGLKSTAIASSFGKVYRMKRQAEREAEDHGNLANGDEEKGGQTFKAEDISRSLLYAVSNNIGQIAYLHAQRHNLEHIYFGGSFIGGHRQTMNTLSYAINFWSKGEKQAYFLRHEGYLGAVGAFLKRQPPNWGRRNSFDGLSRTVSRER